MIKLADTLAPMSKDFYAVESENVGIDIDGTSKSIQQAYEDGDLSSGGSSIQVDTMPIASIDELGKIYEFIGSTGTYVNGYFYECVSDGEPTPTYSWVQKNVQPNAESFELDVKFDVDDLNTAYVPNKTITVRTNENTKNLPPSPLVNFLVTSFAYIEGQYYRITQYCYENSENLSSAMYVRRGVSNNGESSITWSAWKELVTMDKLDKKQDFRIFKSLEEFNEKKGTSLTVVNGVDNMKDIANAMSNGEMLIIITRCELGSEVYFGLTTDTGWTKMFTFIKSNGLCDVECCTTFPLTLKRVLNSDGVVGDWQQLATTDSTLKTTQLSGSVDCNTLTEPGLYTASAGAVSALTNAPVNNQVHLDGGFSILVTNTNVDSVYYGMQMFIPYGSDAPFIRKAYYFNNGQYWTDWRKILSTSVADVPITYINTFEDETYLIPATTNVCSYCVKNGHCIIRLETVCVSTTNEFVQLVSGLPKPKVELFSNAIDRNMKINSGARGVFNILTDGTLRVVCNKGDSSVLGTRWLYGTFSYPVAES